MAAAALALLLRFGWTTPDGYGLGSFVLAPLWIAVVAVNRTYEHRFIGVGTEVFGRVRRAGVTLMAVVAFASYMTKAEVSRGYVSLTVPAVVAFSLIGRCALHAWLHRQWLLGRCVQRTLLVGSGSAVELTAERLRRDGGHGLLVVGACVPEGSGGLLVEASVHALGNLAEIDAAILATNADVVVILPSALLSGAELRRLAWSLEAAGADLVVYSGLTEIAGARITVQPTGHSPMLHVTRARLSGPSRITKATFDRCGALLGLIVIAPLLLSVAAWIWAVDRSTPLFRQTRVGLNGREFTLYKFRTMAPDAESRKVELAEYDEDNCLLFKMVNDPRITPAGRWLRRFSLDELLQLVNVVRGEMSLVGPRPQVPREVSTYGTDYRRRLLVKPGMTGLWQVSGRSNLSGPESETLDLRYVENWTLGLDLLILWRTARAVISGSGAY